MPIILDKLGIAYFDVPKVACTSIKYCIYEQEFGKAFDEADHNGTHIHEYYGILRGQTALPVTEDHFRACEGLFSFAVIRDPIKRLLSAYSNRVLHHDDITKSVQAASLKGRISARLKGLPTVPDIATFFGKLAQYQNLAGSIRWHTRSCADFLGAGLDRFDRVYGIEEMSELRADLEARWGCPVTIPRLQEGGPKFAFDDLARDVQDTLLELTRAEYAFVGSRYEPPR